MLTNNIANSATPNYKAKDIDFYGILQGIHKNTALLQTNAKHLSLHGQTAGQTALYRTPNQSSIDGNTVDDELERKNFIENALRYQVNLTFIKNKTDELSKAVKGG
jgi:flagellar basal-body rod protein FlgB